MSALSLFDDGGTVYWRLMSMFPVLSGVLAIFLIMVPGEGVNFIGYYLREEGEDSARMKLNRVYTPEMTERKI